jgi:hypothetical protein
MPGDKAVHPSAGFGAASRCAEKTSSMLMNLGDISRRFGGAVAATAGVA